MASVGIVAEMTDVEYPESFRGNYCTSTFVVDNSYQLRSHDSLAMSMLYIFFSIFSVNNHNFQCGDHICHGAQASMHIYIAFIDINNKDYIT